MRKFAEVVNNFDTGSSKEEIFTLTNQIQELETKNEILEGNYVKLQEENEKLKKQCEHFKKQSEKYDAFKKMFQN